MTLLLGAAMLPLLAWLYLLLFHGQFWNVGRLGAEKPVRAKTAGAIAVVIPARNEAESIGRAVGSLLRQNCEQPVHIFVVDDNSTDGTADVARAAASGGGNVAVLRGQPLQPGWTGKLWAVQQGIDEALKLSPSFLLLTDADVEHSADNLATLVAIADGQGYDLVSFMVKLHCRTLAEKLLIPAFVFFFFMLYPPLWIRRRSRRTAGAAGGCMLIRPDALQRAGGIAAIRSEIIDDCALARAVKRSGGGVWLGVTRDTHSLREYKSFAEVEQMIARTAFNQLQHSAAILCGAVLGLALLYVLPIGLALSGVGKLSILGIDAYLLMFTAYLAMVRFYGLSFGWALTLPVSAVFYMAATIHSAFKYWTGRGGEWKDRAQDRSGAS